jgi:hypothetical protein
MEDRGPLTTPVNETSGGREAKEFGEDRVASGRTGCITFVVKWMWRCWSEMMLPFRGNSCGNLAVTLVCSTSRLAIDIIVSLINACLSTPYISISWSTIIMTMIYGI